MVSVDGTICDLASTFHVAEINRPLMSVSKICDEGLTCVFNDTGADVMNAKGVAICRFERKGGLYVSKMKFKPPEPFGRHVP